jgi:internalin A
LERLVAAPTDGEWQRLGLQSLRVDGNVGDWRVLSGLTQIKVLNLRSDEQHDLTPLSKLSQLEEFIMTDGAVTDLRPLSELQQLRKISIYWGSVSDLGPLSALAQLELLSLNATYDVTNLSPLFGLSNLKQVDLEGLR